MNLWLEDCKRLDAKVVHNGNGVFQILFGLFGRVLLEEVEAL